MNINRRSFIQAGAIAAGGYFLSEKELIGQEKNGNACVLIFLGGGISHIEFTNPLPSSPAEFRSCTGFVNTKSGYQIGGSFPELAKISDKFDCIRSFGHNNANHSHATGYVLSGQPIVGAEGIPQKDPSHGSMLSYYFGENNSEGVPTYVKINPITYDGAAYLGSKYTGFANDEDGIKNLTLNISENQFNRRLEMVKLIEKQSSPTGLNKEWTDLRTVASKVISGNAGKAFNLSTEDEKYKNLYEINKSQFGKNLLLARRLIEAGVRLSSVNWAGWDHHVNIAQEFPKRAVELDKLLPVFILDLEQRGLLKSTMVIVVSEFGRTSRLNNSDGRDHQAGTNSLLIFGGNRGGKLIGTTDDKAFEITSEKFGPKDLNYTILDHFGIDKNYKIIDGLQRPRHFVDGEAKLIV